MNRVAANLPARRSSSSEEITIEPDGLQTFIDDVGPVVSSTDDEYEITKRVAKRLSELLAGGVARIDTTARTQNGQPSETNTRDVARRIPAKREQRHLEEEMRPA